MVPSQKLKIWKGGRATMQKTTRDEIVKAFAEKLKELV
jgi:hypothetical protein